MQVADQIQAEANAIASNRNGVVISRALRLLKIRSDSRKCSQCRYFDNRLVYKNLLHKYITYKRLASKYKKLYHDEINAMWEHHQNRSEISESYRLKLSSDFSYYEEAANHIKRQMKQIAPCEDCMKAFNPHLRTRRSYAG